MTKSLEKAFAKASCLPEEVQEQLAEQLFDDIEGELKWDKTLANSQEILETMAQKALRDQRDGKTVRKGFDEL
jgi:hypothetical protein